MNDVTQGLPADKVILVSGVLGDVLSKVVKLFKGGGLFGALGLVGDFSDLKGVNKDALLDQLKDLDPDERKACLAAFKASLTLDDKSLEQKIESGADCLDEAVSVGFEAYQVYLQGVGVERKIVALVGGAA